MSKGSITFVGLGLYDEFDISLKGIEIIKNSDNVFAEFYTACLVGASKDNIERRIGKSIHVLSREETEKGDIIIDKASENNIVFLTCGDPMIATTHVDLRLRALEKGIGTRIIHGSSIITAVPGLLGLQQYKFGRTTTLAYPEKDYFPTSPYSVIKDNLEMGLHTLVLLDIKAESERFMTANEGINLLLKMEEKHNKNIIKKDTIVCVVARAGSKDPTIKADKIKNLLDFDFGPPLHSIVVPGKLHFMETEALEKLADLH